MIDKNSSEPGNPEKTADETTAQIGDDVNFTVSFTAKNYVTTAATSTAAASTTKVTEYTFTDTPNGYDIDADSVVVKVGTQVITTTINNIAVSETDGKLTFTIPWVNDEGESLYTDGSIVTVTYTGTVNSDAADGNATNSASVGNNAQDTPKTTTEVETKNYNLTINKTDGTNALVGAQFELYRGETKLSLIAITPDEAAANTVYYRVAEDGETGAVTTIDMSSASSAIIYGLDGDDTYTIHEIKAPAGYNLLDEDVDHAMNNQNGSETIVNESGSTLPSTGGMGTTIFYVLGAILVIGAGVVLVTRRRVTR